MGFPEPTKSRNTPLGSTTYKTLLSVVALVPFLVSGRDDTKGLPSRAFDVSVRPGIIVVTRGAVSSSLTITITSAYRVSNEVTVSLEGLPAGISASPASPFAATPGRDTRVTLFVGGSVPIGQSTLTIRCINVAPSCSTEVTLDVKPVDTLYETDSVLYLESKANGETVRAGVESSWGGSIVELSWNGINPVNRFDAGREVQLALYDGREKYDFTWRTKVYGWDPVQAGDRYSHGSPVLQQAMDSQSIYIKTHPNEWYPDNKGGGPNKPVPTDTYIEQWISRVREHSRTFRVHYKVTHFGTDEHDNSFQEFPAVYVNVPFNRFVYYGDSIPWTSGPLRVVTLPSKLPLPLLYMSEQWGALVNDQGVGLTVYVPNQYPYGVVRSFPGTPGPRGHGTHYYRPQIFFSLAPNAVLEGDAYLIAGDYLAAREVVYELRKEISAADPFPPVGSLDTPTAEKEINGAINIRGWAFDNVAVSKVEVFVDSVLSGRAEYGFPRPDVSKEYPHAPAKIGFSYRLNTAAYTNGSHVLQVKVADDAGNVALFPPVAIRISN